MSSSSELSLFVIDRRDLANFYGAEVAALLAGEPVVLDSQYLHHYESLENSFFTLNPNGDLLCENEGQGSLFSFVC